MQPTVRAPQHSSRRIEPATYAYPSAALAPGCREWGAPVGLLRCPPIPQASRAHSLAQGPPTGYVAARFPAGPGPPLPPYDASLSSSGTYPLNPAYVGAGCFIPQASCTAFTAPASGGGFSATYDPCGSAPLARPACSFGLAGIDAAPDVETGEGAPTGLAAIPATSAPAGSEPAVARSRTISASRVPVVDAIMSEQTRKDLLELPEALANQFEFLFLNSDSHPVHGMQDWSSAEWATQIARNPELAAELTRSVLGPDIIGQPAELARLIKKRLSMPLPRAAWMAVIVFQNASMNAQHEADASAGSFYISSAVLSTAMYRRDFPLGIDDQVMASRFVFAMENSGLSQIRHKQNRVVSCLLFLFILGGALFVVVYLLSYTVGNSSVWTMEATMQDVDSAEYTSDVNKRTKDRGTVASSAIPRLTPSRPAAAAQPAAAPCPHPPPCPHTYALAPMLGRFAVRTHGGLWWFRIRACRSPAELHLLGGCELLPRQNRQD